MATSTWRVFKGGRKGGGKGEQGCVVSGVEL